MYSIVKCVHVCVCAHCRNEASKTKHVSMDTLRVTRYARVQGKKRSAKLLKLDHLANFGPRFLASCTASCMWPPALYRWLPRLSLGRRACQTCCCSDCRRTRWNGSERAYRTLSWKSARAPIAVSWYGLTSLPKCLTESMDLTIVKPWEKTGSTSSRHVAISHHVFLENHQGQSLWANLAVPVAGCGSCKMKRLAVQNPQCQITAIRTDFFIPFLVAIRIAKNIKNDATITVIGYQRKVQFADASSR